MPKTFVDDKDEDSQLSQTKKGIDYQQSDDVTFSLIFWDDFLEIFFGEVVYQGGEVDLIHEIFQDVPKDDIVPYHETYVN